MKKGEETKDALIVMRVFAEHCIALRKKKGGADILASIGRVNKSAWAQTFAAAAIAPMKELRDLRRYANRMLELENDTIPPFPNARNRPVLRLKSLIVPERKVSEGVLVRSISAVWTDIVRRISKDWNVAYQIGAEKWEEIVAGAFKRAGYSDVILTPRSGDFGRDVIASSKGVGCVKIIGSVKAYKPGHLVKHDDVRALLGVLSGEPDASKGFISTTSDFATKIRSDPFIKSFLPTRLELMNGTQLQKWLGDLSKRS